MNSKCDKIRDRIADIVTGILPEKEDVAVEHHLDECAACREYALSLRDEDQLLTGLVGEFEDKMAGLEEGVIRALDQFDTSRHPSIISLARALARSTLTKYAATAVIIASVTAYFAITLSWIYQINECILLSM